MRRSWNSMAAVALVAGTAMALALSACSRQPASLKALKAERALADSLVKGFMPGSTDSLLKVVTLAREKTRKFLLDHKDDVPATVLYTKLRLAETALKPQDAPPPDSTGAPQDHFTRAVLAKSQLADCVEHLDHAIQVEPKNAELYYWKSLVHGLWEPIFDDKQQLDPKRSQLRQAIAAAEKAVALAPDSSNYRTALGSYQMLGGDDLAALKTLRAGKDSTDATLRILSDWERFPRPEGAVYSLRESAGIAEWLAAGGLNDANARVRAYWVAGGQDQIRAFYDQRFEGLYWLSQKQDQKNGEKWAFGSAAVVIVPGGFKAVRKSDLQNASMADAQGISIQVREVRNLTPQSKQAIPFDPGTAVCELLLTDHRRARELPPEPPKAGPVAGARFRVKCDGSWTAFVSSGSTGTGKTIEGSGSAVIDGYDCGKFQKSGKTGSLEVTLLTIDEKTGAERVSKHERTDAEFGVVSLCGIGKP